MKTIESPGICMLWVAGSCLFNIFLLVLPIPGSAAILDRYQGTVPNVMVTSPRGFYFQAVDVTISIPLPAARLAVTFDGSEPAVASAWPVGSNVTLHITNTTILRARAFRENWCPGEISTHSYIFPDSVPAQQAPPGAAGFWQDRTERVAPDWTIDSSVIKDRRQLTDALLALPAISIVTGPAELFGAANGIYVHSLEGGSETIRQASIELIYPDRSTGFQRDAGLRIRGGASRFPAFSPKHGFGLIFRKEFGPGALPYSLFPTSPRHHFNHLVLRPNVNDSWVSTEWPHQRVNGEQRWLRANASYIRDQWVRDSQRAMGQPSAHGIFTHVYLNGLYWGIYNLTERPDDDFAADYLGGKEHEYDVISDGPDLHSGQWTAWRELLRADGLADAVRYHRLLGRDASGIRI